MKHPAAQDALRYIKSRPEDVTDKWAEVFDTADDPISLRCSMSIHKIRLGHEIEDIDILGLAYVMKQGECG